MNQDEFKKMYFGEFKQDPRDEAIDERLAEYYRNTDKCSNHLAQKEWIHFRSWCLQSGYSLDEINAAKRRFHYK